ncbi:MAG TPA: hypothetical protein PK331_12485 [Gordonia sp. (in: high G+C Gram-positive bacteria)]|uniref:LGFP repeat-containing protein n=1 Tax=unclassified Gordonia (in: high G+C Gram-positive bacteria) TaxID=2657482 RepID=UPI000FAD031C|nr:MULTISPECIES: hypothetical protein [unclassified Gordonia (in: high G+C Gram-positive bacteria)]RUP38628.1 MAG: hypothetical protein EKK60_09320 [Gordonia sp. (in: high G+C Gram-positive bacteria)]HNP56239.1 hypothetical protein [Gordonia sp. (in: high G+C Gram-positive bacteria)]HRC51722.1 hypothetical protein [Gordonia sp. (in: high G+C Gram-positive bacteria)]
MRNTTRRRTAATIAGLAAVALIAAGCATDGKGVASSSAYSSAASVSSSVPARPAKPVKVKGADGSMVTLTGPIAARYAAATHTEKKSLGVALTGDRNAGTRASGVVFQQFKGGVISAKNGHPGTPAYITWGKIRKAWNVERAPDGTPDVMGKNGSAGPLGAVTSDEITKGDLKETTFEHGSITFNTKTGKLKVTVNGKVVPAF